MDVNLMGMSVAATLVSFVASILARNEFFTGFNTAVLLTQTLLITQYFIG